MHFHKWHHTWERKKSDLYRFKASWQTVYSDHFEALQKAITVNWPSCSLWISGFFKRKHEPEQGAANNGKHQCLSCMRTRFDFWSLWEHSGWYYFVANGCSLLAYTRGLNMEDDCQSLISIERWIFRYCKARPTNQAFRCSCTHLQRWEMLLCVQPI